MRAPLSTSLLAQAKVRAAVTANWGQSLTKSSEREAGILEILNGMVGDGAKAAWIAESGVEIGSAALAALSAASGPQAGADVLVALPADVLQLYVQAMAPQDIGPIVKVTKAMLHPVTRGSEVRW